MTTKEMVKHEYGNLRRAKDASDVDDIRGTKARIAKIEEGLHIERCRRKEERNVLSRPKVTQPMIDEATRQHRENG